MSDKNLSPLDRIIAEGLRSKGGRQRIAELESQLERGRLTLEEQRKIHEELATLRKRFEKS